MLVMCEFTFKVMAKVFQAMQYEENPVLQKKYKP